MVISKFHNILPVPLSFAVLACCILHQACSTTTQSSIQRENVIVGDNVTFTKCNFSASALLVTLRFGKSEAMTPPTQRIAYKRFRIIIDPPYQNRASFSPSGYLTLRNISAEERGYYQCTIHYESGDEDDTYNYYIDVGVPPVIQPFKLPIIKLFEGRKFEIHCNATGKPAPDIKWYINRTEVTGRPSETLRIIDAKPSHSGVYYCRAINKVKMVEKPLEIQVFPKPKVLAFFQTNDLDGKICECQDVTLKCEAYGNPEVTRFHFYHGASLIKYGSESGVYKIVQIRQEDNGIYTCVPENKMGKGSNKTLEIRVLPVSSKRCGIPCKSGVPQTGKEPEQVESFIHTKMSSEALPTSPGGRSSSTYPRQHAECVVTILLLAHCLTGLA